jgi:hypothetical protein
LDGEAVTLGLAATKNGKAALLTLTPAADLYALSGLRGTITTSATGVSWSGSGASLALDADANGTLRGQWNEGSASKKVTCTNATAAEAASCASAAALLGYASDIDGLADTVLEDTRNAHPKPYTVFAVETARRGSLSLGTDVADSAGALPGEDAETTLDDNDWNYGAMSAAYNLGGGDDYGEWFQGISDGISLSGDVVPVLGGARAGFIAHEKVKALSTLVTGGQPSAVEITVGPWTFFLPDSFAK